MNHIQYSSGVTCLRWLPVRHDPTGMQVLMGYDDGVVRLYGIETEEGGIGGAGGGAGGLAGNIFRLTKALNVKFRLVLAQKPHSRAVRGIVVAEEKPLVATLGDDDAIFFFTFSATTSGISLTPTR